MRTLPPDDQPQPSDDREGLRFLLILADSHLSWALHRYSERWPEDFKKEVNELITEVRTIT